MTSRIERPSIIQGGMGVAISGWPLANAVARRGQLGVVSGTILEVVMARRLQLGDPGGHVRRALDHFPFPAVTERILDAYFVPGGKGDKKPFKNVRTFTVEPDLALQELTVAANFVEVFLAKEGHSGPVGINYLRKIELPIPFSAYGAMLAGSRLRHRRGGEPEGHAGHDHSPVAPRARHASVSGFRGSPRPTKPSRCGSDPADLNGCSPPSLGRPDFLAIVASVELAEGLAALPEPPDGFIVEAPSAGGHNAPPRGPRVTDELGQPVYDERDEVDLVRLAGLGLPFWLAGSFGTPAGLSRRTIARERPGSRWGRLLPSARSRVSRPT